MKTLFLKFALIGLSLFISISLQAQKKPDTLKVKFAGYDGGTISIDSIIKHPALTCSLADFEITTFSLTIPLNGDLVEYRQNNGGKLTEMMLKKLKTLKAGDKFYVEDIKAAISTKSRIDIIPMPAMKFLIK